MGAILSEEEVFGPPKKKRGVILSESEVFGANADDPGFIESIAIGAGRTLDRAAKGLEQGFNTIIGNQSELDRMKREEDEATRLYAKLQEARPGATFVGEALPMLSIPAVGGLRGAAAVSAIPGLIEYGTPEEKLTKGALGAGGGALGYGAGKLVGNVLSPGAKPVGEVGRLASVMDVEQVPLNVAQRTGSPSAQKAASALKSIPWTSGKEAAKEAERQLAFNRALLRKIGENAKAATPDVLAQADARIGDTIETIASQTALKVDDRMLNEMAKLEQEHAKRLTTDQWKPLASYFDDLLATGGTISGETYQLTRSKLGRVAFKTENPDIEAAAKGLQRILDNTFDRQAPASLVDKMHTARKQWRGLSQITEAIEKGRSQTGDIGAKQLYAAVQRTSPGFAKGSGGDLADLARAGRQFLPDPEANTSRTAQSALWQNLMTMGSLGGLGAGFGYATGGDPLVGAALGVGGAAASRGASSLLNSPAFARYLARDTMSAAEKKLLEKYGAIAGMIGTYGAMD